MSFRALRNNILILFFTAGLITGCADSDITPVPPETTKPVAPTQTPTVEPEEEPVAQTTPEEEAPKEDKPAFSIDDPNSIWVILNKTRPLNPINFVPADLSYPEGVTNSNGQPLRYDAAVAAENLIFAAAGDGVYIGITSAFRGYDLQTSLYNNYAARDGAQAADRYSARPGHSEHQTGLAVDFDDFGGCGLQQCFENTAAGIWLRDNAHVHGFVMRYPDGYEHITGFMYEPWHFRYVGKELAGSLKNSGVKTLEEWFNLPAAPDYL